MLVDEYDNPIINNLKNLEVASQNRDIIKKIFATLKSLDEYIQFTFVTGVSKFSQVALFSGPNHLQDITMDTEYADILGYTEEAINSSFSEHIQAMLDKGVYASKEKVVEDMRKWYNGYRFSAAPVYVYNPFSTLNFLKKHTLEGYWYSSGTPSFLIDEIKKHPEAITSMGSATAKKATLSDISRLDKIHLVALMFQTGYLTIKKYDPKQKHIH